MSIILLCLAQQVMSPCCNIASRIVTGRLSYLQWRFQKPASISTILLSVSKHIYSTAIGVTIGITILMVTYVYMSTCNRRYMCQCIYVVLYIYYTCISVYMNTCEVYFKCSVKQVVVGMLWIVLSDNIQKSIANSKYI